MVYAVGTTEDFDREFKKRHRDKVEWLEKIKEKLKDSPESGKPLKGRLYGIWQMRIGPFRLWYEINDFEKKVILKTIIHKDDAEEHY